PTTTPQVKMASTTTPKPMEKPKTPTNSQVQAAPVWIPSPQEVATTDSKPETQKPANRVNQKQPSLKSETVADNNTFRTKSVSTSHRLPDVALDGCCPVTLREQNKQVKGRPEFICIWKRASYYFVSLDAQHKFEANPRHYVTDLPVSKPSAP
ncbi:MAG: hypothetical protein KDA84_00830, partial [Planctomycetaceae bacterium]|nr:hypothetical protein [Planctomycetaceae bacterium]